MKAVVAVRRRRQDAADEQRNKVGQVVDLTIRSVDTKYYVSCLVTELMLLCRLLQWQLLRKIWREQVLPIGNEQYSSLKSMTSEEVSAS